MRKYLVISLILSISTAYAAPISQCLDILNLSRSDFDAQINDPNQVQAVSQTLNSCAHQNACAQINGMSDCAAKLANRTFDSNFKAYEASAANTNATNNANAAPNTAAPTNASVAPANNPAPASIAPLANPNSTAPAKQSINWF